VGALGPLAGRRYSAHRLARRRTALVRTSTVAKARCGVERSSGAPRPMKMGTIASPWRYDAATADALRSDNQRRTAILPYASRAAVFPISPGGPVTFGCGDFDQSREQRNGLITDKEIVPSGYGGTGNFVLKKATTAGLNSRWNAARSKSGGSRQIPGAKRSVIGVQGARKAKCPALGTT